MAAAASLYTYYTRYIHQLGHIYTPLSPGPTPAPLLSLMRRSGQRQCRGQRYVPPPPPSPLPLPAASPTTRPVHQHQQHLLPPPPPPTMPACLGCSPPSLTLMSRIGIAFVSPRLVHVSSSSSSLSWSSWRTLGTTRRAIFIILVSFALNLFLFFCFPSLSFSLCVCLCVCVCVRSTGLTPPFR